MEDPRRYDNDNNSGGDDWQQEPWKQYEKKGDAQKPAKINLKDTSTWPSFDSPTALFSLRNQRQVFILPHHKMQPRYSGVAVKELKALVNAYDQQFKNGDQFLENLEGLDDRSRAAILKTPIGKLAVARDQLLTFLFNLYQTDKNEWNMLRMSGFLEIIIQVAAGGTCNNELAKELRKCLD